ncbi:MAG: CCA tRNA nucleotidyltransferase [Planctomycetota bacterium]
MSEAGDESGRSGHRVDLRTAAVQVVRTLIDAGHEAYFAGGCVRDRLMGGEPTDYDIATDARPEAVSTLYRRAQRVGEAFGVMLVKHHGHPIQIATFRTEGVYSDGRHPDSVSFSDAEHDARRRDFTINGLFEDPLADKVIDYVGGRADLAAGVIRAIGDPEARLREDALRMLRAVRFAARFEFAIEGGTGEAIRAAAGDLRGVSRERIGQELKWMLSHPNRAVAARELQSLGLDGAVLQEPCVTAAPRRLECLPADAPYPTALAAWLLDRTDEAPDLIEQARRWARSLLLSNADRDALCRNLEIHRTLTGPWPQLGVAGQKRLAARPEFEQALAVLKAGDNEAFVDVRRQVEALARTQIAPPPLISGEDLIGLGLTPGPLFKQVLDSVYDAQLEGSLGDKAEALRLARAIAEAPRAGPLDG